MFFLFSITSLLSCKSRHVYLRGVYNEEPYQLASVDRRGSLTGGWDIEVKCGKRPAILLAYPYKALYDRPYTPDIFQGHPHQFFDTNHAAYTNKIAFAKVSPVMLHFDKKRFSLEDYEHYASFFANEWPQIVLRREEIKRAEWLEAGYPADEVPPAYDFRLVGTAYGSRLSYSQIFVAEENDGHYLIRITPEGDITYEKGKNPNSSSDMHMRFNFNLVRKIQMPGKIIVMQMMPQSMTKEELLRYKDSEGKSLEDYFTIKQEPFIP